MERSLLLMFGTACSIGACMAQTVTDIDGNVYPTVVIGSQVWMAENLKVTRYQNGDTIPNVTQSLVWDYMVIGARCYYDNDSAAYSATYGALYNWYAMVDERQICPAGWHVSTDHEWNVLALYLDPTVDTLVNGSWSGTDIGGQLKEVGTVHWNAPNEGATNSSGFTALPAGQRYGENHYRHFNEEGLWWTSSPGNSAAHGWYRSVHYLFALIKRLTYFKDTGMSCRCVSDLSTGLNEVPLDDPDIRIHPIPASDHLWIAGKSEGPATLRVLDTAGRCMLQQQVTIGSYVDVGPLAPGPYIVQLSGPGMNVRRRLIKE